MENQMQDETFLSLKKTEDGDRFVICGNAAGLKHFCELIHDLIDRNIDGAHQHFDEISNFDICEIPFEIELIINNIK